MQSVVLHVQLDLEGIEMRIKALARLFHRWAIHQKTINLRICALQSPVQPLPLPFSLSGDIDVSPGRQGLAASSFYTDCFWHDRSLPKPIGA
jgi:hypothetical protein